MPGSKTSRHTAKMSAVWRVCERAELGQVGRQWELEKIRSLSIGRSSDSDIQISVSSDVFY